MAMTTLPSIGERMARGYLRSKKVKIPRRRLREAIRRVDPDGLNERKSLLQRRVKRRVYSVPNPHYLWHIDGNHKLIRWGMVIHCGIDGYSRACVYLNCANNNRSDTVLHSFQDAVSKYNVVPQHVRSDYGTENVLVWEAMIATYQDASSPPVLLGSSVHNQRVERFNGEINRNIRIKYSAIFYSLENKGLLSVDDELDLFSLHYVFIPRINDALCVLANAHNNHCISTEGNSTPNQMLATHNHVVPAHDNAAVVAQLHDNQPQPILTDYDFDFLIQNVPPRTADEDHGCTVYQAVREYVHLYAS